MSRPARKAARVKTRVSPSVLAASVLALILLAVPAALIANGRPWGTSDAEPASARVPDPVASVTPTTEPTPQATSEPTRKPKPKAQPVVGSGGKSCEAVPGSRVQRQPRPGPALLIGGPGLPTARCRLPALFVAGECVVVWHADAGGFGGQVVIHQPGGPDGAIPDPFGRVDHVRRRRLVGLGDAAQQPGATLRPQVGVRGDPGRGAAAESVPRRAGITGRVRLLVNVWSPAVLAAFGVFVAQLVDQGLDLVVVQAGIDVRQAHRDTHSGGGSADHAAGPLQVFRLDRTDAMRGRKLNQKPSANRYQPASREGSAKKPVNR